MEETFPTLEGFLGKKLPLDQQWIYDRFNDLPEEIIETARKLPRRWVYNYIEFYTTPRNWDYIVYFIEDILSGKKDLKYWHTSVYLAPSPIFKELLTNELYFFYNELYQQIKYIPITLRQEWNQNATCLGSPMIFVDNIDITFTSPKGMYSLSGKQNVIEISDDQSLDIIFRRWIATRMARMLYRKPEFLTFHDPQIFHEYAPIETWTKDALVAFRGLVREREEIGWPEDQVPGFIAPDDYYSE